jgi:hypothetical protein
MNDETAIKIMYQCNLNISQVENVVENWYAEYRSKNIGVLQSTGGCDLEELIPNSSGGNVIKKYKLTPKEVLILVSFWYDEIYIPYGQQAGLIETELKPEDLAILFGEKIVEDIGGIDYLFCDEKLELEEYLNLEFLKLEENELHLQAMIKLSKKSYETLENN